MFEKPRNPKRSPGGPNRSVRRGPAEGKPGERPAAHRSAGKPVKALARPRSSGGVDEQTLELLEREGLLTEEGRRVRQNLRGPGEGKAPRSAEGRPFRPEGRAVKAEGRTDRAAGRTVKAEGRAARPDKPVGRPESRPLRVAALPARKAGRKGAGDAEKEVAQRLHKVMAQSGVASRRHSEELILAGRVTVNGQVVSELGTKVVPGRDLIEVDGKALGRPESLVYILLNKPKHYVTTMYDPEGRSKVTDLLEGGIAERVYPVGRLDYDTEGLLLLTNDGELANALMHPAREVKKTYIAKLRGVPGPAKLRALEEGIELEDGPTAPAEVKMIDVKAPNASTVSIRIHEGRNRQVRRMFEALGHEVIHLRRTTLGPLSLGNLEPGQWRELSAREVADLRLSVGLPTRKRGQETAGEGEKRGRIPLVRGTARPSGRRGVGRFTPGRAGVGAGPEGSDEAEAVTRQAAQFGAGGGRPVPARAGRGAGLPRLVKGGERPAPAMPVPARAAGLPRPATAGKRPGPTAGAGLRAGSLGMPHPAAEGGARIAAKPPRKQSAPKFRRPK